MSPAEARRSVDWVLDQPGEFAVTTTSGILRILLAQIEELDILRATEDARVGEVREVLDEVRATLSQPWASAAEVRREALDILSRPERVE
jgi:hypothetical protein